jgi:hypothetical protein
MNDAEPSQTVWRKKFHLKPWHLSKLKSYTKEINVTYSDFYRFI